MDGLYHFDEGLLLTLVCSCRDEMRAPFYNMPGTPSLNSVDEVVKHMCNIPLDFEPTPKACRSSTCESESSSSSPQRRIRRAVDSLVRYE